MTYSIAVLGANGFIGSRVVEMLHLAGQAKMRPVVRRRSALASSSRFALDGRVADAHNVAALISAFRGCEYVVHAVAGDIRTIVDSIEPVYRAAQAAGVLRLIYLSSAMVHGQSPSAGTDETSILNERQAIDYNNAKIQAERRLEDLRRSGAVEVVVLRPGIVFGPRSSWTGGFADGLLAGTVYLVEGGHGICNSAYIDNLVHAIRLAIEVPESDRQAYLIGDSEQVTWAELCRPIAVALGFDLEAISVPAPSSFQPGWQQKIRDSHALRYLIDGMPQPVRRGLKAGYAEWRKTRNNPGQFGLSPRINISEERALLHRCQTKLHSIKAERELGYRPVVSFEEACRRSVGWLTFAGFPTVEARAGRQ
jgi:2-alkyl-3-oxoalkanoate reductase